MAQSHRVVKLNLLRALTQPWPSFSMLKKAFMLADPVGGQTQSGCRFAVNISAKPEDPALRFGQVEGDPAFGTSAVNPSPSSTETDSRRVPWATPNMGMDDIE